MKKSFKSFLACLLALMLVIPAFSGVMAEVGSELKLINDGSEYRSGSGKAVVESGLTDFDASTVRNGRTFAASDVEARESLKPNDIVTIIVELEAAPAVDVTKDVRSAGDYRGKLLSTQKVAAENIAKKYGVEVNVLYNYSVVFNGFAFEGEYRLVEEINKIDGMRAFVSQEWDTPTLFNTPEQVGAIDAWNLGYSGKGYAVAIIDTGCMVDHPAFSVMPDEDSVQFTRDDIAALIDGGELNGAGNSQLTIDNVYVNAKIPFRWNYYGNNSSVAHGSSDHGTHVAGIAAGNNDVITGIARDAQIIAMQVFNPTGGASWATIIRALEDCVVIGVSAANLSLGSANGSETVYDPSYEAVLERCAEAGVNLAMSAGNDYDSAMCNRWGDNFGVVAAASLKSGGYTPVNNIDFGVVGSPSTWPYGVSVAAVQNSKSQNYFIEVNDVKYSYTENDANPVLLRDALGDQTVEIAFIEGPGNPEDFEGVDVEGKAVFVERGSINFVAKAANAEAAGAVACIVYNNTSGSINMVAYEGGGIPHVFMLQEDALEIKESGATEIFVGKELGTFDADNANQTTDFSSRGFTSNMAMKPEITAPGGAIYSSTDPTVSQGLWYDTWNGTSMSAPHITGGMAIVSEYVDVNFPEASDLEKHDLVTQILMSTTSPVDGANGVYAPVHQQGAGAMNLTKATTTTAYITVEDTQGNRPKLNLGDDPEKTGADYAATFTVHNFGEEDLTYTIQPSVLVQNFAKFGDFNGEPLYVYYGGMRDLAATEEDDAIIGDVNGDGKVTIVDAILISRMALGIIDNLNKMLCDVNGDGKVTIEDALLATRIALQLMETETGRVDFGYVDFDMPRLIKVPAGGETTVELTFTLKEEVLDYLNYYYTAGAMLEGFFELMPTEGDVSLTVPFIKFYGDWNESAALDYGYYYEDEPLNSNNFPNTVGYKSGNNIYGLGINPYVQTDDLTYYIEDRNAISPNGDKFMDTVNVLYAGLLRNSITRCVIENTEGSELYEVFEEDWWAKGYRNRNGGREQFGVTYSAFPSNIDFTQFGAEDVVIRLTAYLDNDGKYTTNEFTPDVNQNPEWLIPVHVDTVVPTATVASVDGENVTVLVSDDHYVAALIVLDQNQKVKSSDGVFETERGIETELTVAIAEGEFAIVADYAGNENMYKFDGEQLVPYDPEDDPQDPQGEPYFSMSFEPDESLAGWNIYDADGDGNNFSVFSNPDAAYDGDRFAGSRSWSSSSGALTPDNWMIAPSIALPEGTPSFTFYAAGYEPNYCYEHFAMYIIETANYAGNVDDFIEILPETVLTEEWQQFTIDLSEYAGKDVRIAIHHFNCSDQNMLKLDLWQIWE